MNGRIYDAGVGPYPPRVPQAKRTPADQRLTNRVGVSIPCEAVSSRRIAVFSPIFFELYMYRRDSFPGMDTLSSPYAAELHDLEPISDRPVWLVSPHRAERYRPGGSPFPLGLLEL